MHFTSETSPMLGILVSRVSFLSLFLMTHRLEMEVKTLQEQVSSAPKQQQLERLVLNCVYDQPSLYTLHLSFLLFHSLPHLLLQSPVLSVQRSELSPADEGTAARERDDLPHPATETDSGHHTTTYPFTSMTDPL